MTKKLKPLSHRDWDQLMVLASGYLTLTGGNLELAMARAIEAHARLIDSVKKGRITTRVGKGTVRLVVPEEGGLALEFEVPDPPPGSRPTPPPAAPASPASPGVVVASIAPPPLEPSSPIPRPPPDTDDPPTFPDVSFEVFERPSSHTTVNKREDAGTMDE